MTHADFINIGKSQGNTQVCGDFTDGSHFSAHITGWFFNSKQIHIICYIPIIKVKF